VGRFWKKQLLQFFHPSRDNNNNNNNIYLGKSNQAARKGTGPSKLATQKSNKENAIHAQKNIQTLMINVIFATYHTISFRFNVYKKRHVPVRMPNVTMRW